MSVYLAAAVTENNMFLYIRNCDAEETIYCSGSDFIPLHATNFFTIPITSFCITEICGGGNSREIKEDQETNF